MSRSRNGEPIACSADRTVCMSIRTKQIYEREKLPHQTYHESGQQIRSGLAHRHGKSQFCCNIEIAWMRHVLGEAES